MGFFVLFKFASWWADQVCAELMYKLVHDPLSVCLQANAGEEQ